MLENTGMTRAYPTTSPAMNPEPTDLTTADSAYRHEGLDPAKVIGSMQYAACSCRPALALVCSSLGSERQKKTLVGLLRTTRWHAATSEGELRTAWTRARSGRVVGSREGAKAIALQLLPGWWQLRPQTWVALATANGHAL